MMKRQNFLIKNVIDSMDKTSKGTILRSMAIFAAIELCGSILNGETGQGRSEKNFMKFCNCNYMPNKYQIVSELLLKIFRCGVAHSYISKGAALLSSDPKDRRKHLNYYINGLFIYVPTLDKDVRGAIRKLYKDVKGDATMEAKYKNVTKQLETDGLNAYAAFLKKYNIKPTQSRIDKDIIVDIV